ncbi:unnamed protein product, partial [Brassica oleracea var. botrytis]
KWDRIQRGKASNTVSNTFHAAILTVMHITSPLKFRHRRASPLPLPAQLLPQISRRCDVSSACGRCFSLRLLDISFSTYQAQDLSTYGSCSQPSPSLESSLAVSLESSLVVVSLLRRSRLAVVVVKGKKGSTVRIDPRLVHRRLERRRDRRGRHNRA